MTGSVTKDDLTMAVLAMDVYSRGPNNYWLTAPQLNRGSYGADPSSPDLYDKIGDATIIAESSSGDIPLPYDGTSVGFFAVAYQIGTQIVISYRGTVADDHDDGVFYNDVLNGWMFPSGDTDQAQLFDALKFYQYIAGSVPTYSNEFTNITLTGQSLGGGLAGFVSYLYGTSSVLIDAEPFERVTDNVYNGSPAGDSSNARLTSLAFGGDTAFPETGQGDIRSFSIEGEVLGLLRAVGDPSFSDTALPVADNGQLGPIQLHSSSLAVIRMYAEAYSLPTTWQAVSNYIFPALYDNNVPNALGIFTDGPYGDRAASEITRAIIAYTAIGGDSPTDAPFGTTALASLYHDAVVLGQLVGSGLPLSMTVGLSGALGATYRSKNPDATVSTTPDSLVSALTDILLQYAEDQGISSTTDPKFADGAFSLSASDFSVVVDPSKWHATYEGGVGLTGSGEVLGTYLFATEFLTSFMIKAHQDFLTTSGGQSKYLDMFDQVEAVVPEVTSIQVAVASDAALTSVNVPQAYDGRPGAAFLLGMPDSGSITCGNGSNFVFGCINVTIGDGNNLVFGEGLPQTIVTGSGNNLILAYDSAISVGKTLIDGSSIAGTDVVVGNGNTLSASASGADLIAVGANEILHGFMAGTSSPDLGAVTRLVAESTDTYFASDGYLGYQADDTDDPVRPAETFYAGNTDTFMLGAGGTNTFHVDGSYSGGVTDVAWGDGGDDQFDLTGGVRIIPVSLPGITRAGLTTLDPQLLYNVANVARQDDGMTTLFVVNPGSNDTVFLNDAQVKGFSEAVGDPAEDWYYVVVKADLPFAQGDEGNVNIWGVYSVHNDPGYDLQVGDAGDAFAGEYSGRPGHIVAVIDYTQTHIPKASFGPDFDYESLDFNSYADGSPYFPKSYFTVWTNAVDPNNPASNNALDLWDFTNGEFGINVNQDPDQVIYHIPQLSAQDEIDAAKQYGAEEQDIFYVNSNTQSGEIDSPLGPMFDPSFTSYDGTVTGEIGSSGVDDLTGGSHPTTFEGNGAPQGESDVERGNSGDDRYLFAAGYGHLEIQATPAVGEASSSTLAFGVGVSSSTVTTENGPSGSLVIFDGTAGDQVTLDATAPGSADAQATYGIEQVTFSDGSSCGLDQLLALNIVGTVNADTLVGTDDANTFDGKGAPQGQQDVEQGNGGSDTFVYLPGYGHLEVDEDAGPGATSYAWLNFGKGISWQDISATADDMGNVYLFDGEPGDEIKLDQQLVPDQTGSMRFGVYGASFADGSYLNVTQLMNLRLTGTAGADTLVGSGGPNVFDGMGAPAGSEDYDQGNGTNDAFVFSPGYGQLEIYEQANYGWASSAVLALGSGIDVSALDVTGDASGALTLTDGVSGDSIRLDGQLNLNYAGTACWGVAQVHLADGTILSAKQLADLAATGTPGADVLYGGGVADTFDGHGAPAGGQDFEQGRGGNASFVFDPGYGQLEVDERAGAGRTSSAVLSIGPGLDASDLSAEGDASGTLTLTDGIAGDDIKLDGQLDLDYAGTAEQGVAQVQFADGSTISARQLADLATSGTLGADFLYGGALGETFDGYGAPAGTQDFEEGSGSAAVYVFDPGYGRLEVNEDTGLMTTSTATLRLGAEIGMSDVSVTGDASGNLFLADGVSGDLVELDGQMRLGPGGTAEYGVGQVQFSDGTVLSAQQLATMATTGTPGADSLYGSGAANTFNGGGAPLGSQDYEQGNGGADTFLFAPGYGQLEIDEDAGLYSTTSAFLQLGAGIAPGDVSVAVDGSGNLSVTDAVSGDRITIDAMNTSGWDGYSEYGVGSMRFADGSQWNNSQLLLLAVTGTTGSDVITGTSGDDVLDGRGGNDLISGGGGNDTYIYRQGYGALTIDNSAPGATSAEGVIDIGSGISDQDLWFSRSGNDLIAQVLNSSDVLDVRNWYGSDPSAQVTRIALADGSILDRSAVDQVVTAMATYQSQSPGFAPSVATSMPSDPSLLTAIANGWHT